MKRARIRLDAIRGLATIPVFDPNDPVSLAGVFEVSRASAYAMVKRGDLPHLRFGSRVVIPVPALLRALGEESPVLIERQAEAAGQRPNPHETAPAALTSKRA